MSFSYLNLKLNNCELTINPIKLSYAYEKELESWCTFFPEPDKNVQEVQNVCPGNYFRNFKPVCDTCMV